MSRTKAKKRKRGKDSRALEPKRWCLVDESNLPPPALPPAAVIERSLRRLEGGLEGRVLLEERDRAQDLAFEAMEALDVGDLSAAVDLATEAIDVHPLCVDALLVLDECRPASPDLRIEVLRAIVSAGEEDLGPETFERDRGHFWGVLETRPYMRARGTLAACLLAARRTAEAIAEYEGMLDLNPNDNQGCRGALLGLYLEEGRTEDARRLLEKYEGDVQASHAWGRVLERVLSGDEAGALDAVSRARRRNPHVEDHLLGRRSVPARLPDYYAPGQESEAWVVQREIGRAWKRHPEALAWLKGAGA